MNRDSLQPNHRSQSARALLADSDARERGRLVDQLEQLGIAVTPVATGSEAIEAALNAEFDLMLIGLELDEIDGEQVVQLIRGSGLSTPIIALTGPSPTLAPQASAATQDYALIPKPVDLAALGTLVSAQIRMGQKRALERPSDGRPSTAGEDDPIIEDEVFQAIQQQFLTSLQADYLDPLEQALREQAADAAQAALHKLKGSAGSFGYTDLGSLAGDAEARLKRGDSISQIAPAIDKLRVEAKRLQDDDPIE